MSISVAQIPAGYYNGTSGLQGNSLKAELQHIIRGHNKRSYNQLWTDFQTTDVKSNGKVWDMYSDVPSGTPSYEFTFSSDQCGNYTGEGSCYNREHSLPKSWWGGAQDTMYSDLFHLVPTDGYVNSKRSNHPFGEVGSATWTSTNGCMVGTSNYPGYSGTVFEPIDDYKGDFARNYFYMATRYMSKFSSWNSDMIAGNDFSTWALNMLIDWHNNDPVSQKELDRNDDIYGIQGNRNPFIDHPEWVADIWNPSAASAPTFASGFPQSANEANTSFDLLVKQNKIGTAYYVVLTNGASQPSATQVKEGKDASGTVIAANLRGNINIAAANTSYTQAISSLTAATYYDVFVVSEDNSTPTNLQSSATLLDVTTTGGGGSGGGTTTYAENFDTDANWQSTGGYGANQYQLPSPSHNDLFTSNNTYKETNDSKSAPNSWRLEDASDSYFRYECEGTVSSFSVWAARWDNSPSPNVTVKYSVNSGSSYTTLFTFTGSDFSGDKVFKQFSHSFASPISNVSGQKIYIAFYTTSGERMMYDDFEIEFGSGGGSSSNSNESNIVKNSSWSEPLNIDYTAYSASSGLTTSNAIEVAKFTLQDGGNDNTDTDTEQTKLTDLELTIDNWENIKALAIFDGATKLSEQSVSSSTVSFASISGGIIAADELEKDFSIYATFKTVVTDNQNIKFSISSATADAAGSTFAANDAGGAFTDNSGDKNKIEVSANHLTFISNNPPADVDTDTDFEVEVEALDVNDNRDLDASQSVSLTKASGGGVLSSASGLSANLSSGIIAWSDVQYDTEEVFTISASAAGLTSVTSSNITATTPSQANYFSDLIITEYVEGSSNNKYLEIWNNTGASVNLGDYKVQIYANGSQSAGNTANLSGTLADQAVYVIANNNATVWGGTADLVTDKLSFNGNDVVALVNNNAKGDIDILGTKGSNTNFAKDKTLSRKASVTEPSSTYDAAEWDTKSKDNVDGLGNPGPLPVELLRFEANVIDNTVAISWITASETNNDFFSVLKSYDAMDFSSIAEIDGHGNSNTMQYYEYTDVVSDRTVYYKLKQTDFDGKYTFSNTIAVSESNSGIELKDVLISDAEISLNVFSIDGGSISIEIIDLSGRLQFSTKKSIVRGVNHYNISRNKLYRGMYILHIYNERESIIEKLIL